MNKPIIGIVTRPAGFDNTSILKINETLRIAVNRFGGIAIGILPPQNFEYNKVLPLETKKFNFEDKENIISQINLCDGIILPGGNKWYEYDEFIASYAINNNIPILGICMGMQIIDSIYNIDNNVVHDDTQINKTIINHNQPGVRYVHKVYINPNSLLHHIIKKDVIFVNSRHNYHCDDNNNFLVSAYSSDGLLEAIEMPHKHFVLGLQWHPEDMISYDEDAVKIFKYFINECMKYKEKKA